jgi:hypothetical protein
MPPGNSEQKCGEELSDQDMLDDGLQGWKELDHRLERHAADVIGCNKQKKQVELTCTPSCTQPVVVEGFTGYPLIRNLPMLTCV